MDQRSNGSGQRVAGVGRTTKRQHRQDGEEEKRREYKRKKGKEKE